MKKGRCERGEVRALAKRTMEKMKKGNFLKTREKKESCKCLEWERKSESWLFIELVLFLDYNACFFDYNEAPFQLRGPRNKKNVLIGPT